MLWRSVVGKLAITILLLVSFVLFILTILLLEFFENFHIHEAEKDLLQTANKVSIMLEEDDDTSYILETTERVKDPSSKVFIVLNDGSLLISETTNEELAVLDKDWFRTNVHISNELLSEGDFNQQITIPNSATEVMAVATSTNDLQEVVFVYQSLDAIDQTRAETTRIIFLTAGIAIILTTIFAFFLSTRISSPLIKMREAALDLTRGEFDTKVPILTNDEIGELGIAFNRMGDRKSTRLNSSHVAISYAVFCLKKKNVSNTT